MNEIEIIYQKYYKTVKGYALTLCFDEDLAEDITQETFFKAIKSYEKFNHKCKVETWLCQIAKNTFLNLKRPKPTENIDDYLFLDDVMYVDLRPYSWVARDGHIAGFSFYPFYDLIAHLNFKDRLFKMSSNGGVGNIGCFTPNYEESEFIINELFSNEKKIFAISQSGLESCYFLNLLIQLGYNPANLYNVGGFAINAGLESKAYINLDNPRYLVEGNPFLDANVTTTFNFMKELTPLNKE